MSNTSALQIPRRRRAQVYIRSAILEKVRVRFVKPLILFVDLFWMSALISRFFLFIHVIHTVTDISTHLHSIESFIQSFCVLQCIVQNDDVMLNMQTETHVRRTPTLFVFKGKKLGLQFLRERCRVLTLCTTIERSLLVESVKKVS